MKVLALPLLAAGLLSAQSPPLAAPPTPTSQAQASQSQAAQQELQELSIKLSEAGNSPKDYIRVLEAHLAKYPNSPKQPEIEKGLAQAAIEAHDNPRIIQYGELQLKRDPADINLLDHVTRAYLDQGTADGARKALAWTTQYEQALAHLRTTPPPGRLTAGQWSKDLSIAEARELVLKAKATGLLGDGKGAITLAEKSYKDYPSAEAAREQGKWLAATGQTDAAIEHYADAFTIEDPRSTEADRAKDRRKLGELYTKLHGSEKGLGEIVLAAYDRTSGLMTDIANRLKSEDPNSQASSILDFTLQSPNSAKLPLASFKGKTIVLDFWATWCGPCKAQRPLYEQVEKKFQADKDVVFLSVNTDEDRAQVPEFLKKQHWTNSVYYDGGLAEFLKVNSIPTTLIVDRAGQIASRMNGFIPDRFVDLLTQRIEETRR